MALAFLSPTFLLQLLLLLPDDLLVNLLDHTGELFEVAEDLAIWQVDAAQEVDL